MDNWARKTKYCRWIDRKVEGNLTDSVPTKQPEGKSISPAISQKRAWASTTPMHQVVRGSKKSIILVPIPSLVTMNE